MLTDYVFNEKTLEDLATSCKNEYMGMDKDYIIKKQVEVLKYCRNSGEFLVIYNAFKAAILTAKGLSAGVLTVLIIGIELGLQLAKIGEKTNDTVPG